MESYTDILTDALTAYFNTLKYYGYRNERTVHKLLVLTFLDELILGKYNIDITDDQYELLERAIVSLLGDDCLLSHKQRANLGKYLHAYTQFVVVKNP